MREISTIKRRILEFLDYKGITKYECYQKTGITNGVFSQSSGISEDNLLKFLSYYKEISTDWLFSGVGEMLVSASTPTLRPLEKDTQDSIGQAIKSNHGIPLIPIDAMAGFLSGDCSTVMEYECEYYHIPSFRGAEFMIPVKGSSMQPKYNSGDIVACKRLPLDTFFLWHKVYVVDTEQGVLIKRIDKADNDEYVKLVSENPDYQPVELHRSHIFSIAAVIGLIRLE